jgi:hypothetical protein
VIVDLVGERVLRGDKNIGQETGLGWRDICKPTARGIGVCGYSWYVKYLPTHFQAGRRTRLCRLIDEGRKQVAGYGKSMFEGDRSKRNRVTWPYV